MLVFKFGLQEHWETARRFLLKDPDEDCRMLAADCLYILKRNTSDRASLELLASIVRNKQESRIMRKTAYISMRFIIHYNPIEHRDSMDRSLDRDADWAIVDSYLPQKGFEQ